MSYILKKTSKQGRSYYHTGEVTCLDAEDGNRIVVSETGYLPGDAKPYPDVMLASNEAALLNMYGIGGAPWLIVPVEMNGPS